MRVWASIWLLVLLAACATPTPFRSVAQAPSDKQWQGRLSVTVQSDPPRNMSAGFSLDGDAKDIEVNDYIELVTVTEANESGETRYSLDDHIMLEDTGEKHTFTKVEDPVVDKEIVFEKKAPFDKFQKALFWLSIL